MIAPVAGHDHHDDDDHHDEDDHHDGDDDTDDESDDGIEIETGTTIILEGETSDWVGAEPEEIEGEENPTLVLEEGEEYEIGWEQGNGGSHNLELVDEDDEVVDEHETEVTDDPGEDDIFEFEATDEMAEYVCRQHPDTMRGEIRIE
ncbi:hypothetical protein [Natronorubrum aibiense]|uniref:Blue (type 1) copper domain-containing protein n=1 Tax=Natronorubrum aibiense TaxID=348826 RepID=A0A5P9P9E7_9EURY|nr:hypothetical protein [Natronorubrum aibiense]QFU84769.1 hypothetical protein GCU68_19855 [Natronorubrum aibiense]